MKTSYNWLQSFFDKKLPEPEKLADLLTLRSFEIESVEKKGKDWILDIDILPNRAHDCASHRGVGREIAAILNYKMKSVDYKLKYIKEKITDFLKIRVTDNILCSRYTARMLINVKVASSPSWIVERLEVCGLRSINNVVDICNYVMLETGQPLHAFDFDKLGGNKVKNIIVRKAEKEEKITSLDDQKFDLDEDILLIADDEKPLCIAGIKGGQGPEVDKSTKKIVLEAANFDYLTIRRTSKKLKLVTDASWRFEREPDADLTKEAIDMAASLIQQVTGAGILSGLIDVYSKTDKDKKIALNPNYAKNLLGIEIKDKEIKHILENLGFKSSHRGDILEVVIPSWRKDINIQEDLIEEIGRLYGLEKIPGRMPLVALISPQKNDYLIYRDKTKDILLGLGFCEAYNRSLVSEREVSLGRKKSIELANPISQEQKYLRTYLMPSLVSNLIENKKRVGDIRMFELGRVFEKIQKDKKQTTKEQKSLAGIISLENTEKQTPFYELKGGLDLLFNKLGITDCWYDDAISVKSSIPGFYQPAKRAEIKTGEDVVGWLGEINKEILDNYKIYTEAAGFELDFEKLVRLASEEKVYIALSKYPSVVRDISILVGKDIKVAQVLNIINRAGGKLVQDVDLFDMYKDEENFEGRKSLAFHVVYQSKNRTLTDKEVNKLHSQVIKALEKEGWEVRKQ